MTGSAISSPETGTADQYCTHLRASGRVRPSGPPSAAAAAAAGVGQRGLHRARGQGAPNEQQQRARPAVFLAGAGWPAGHCVLPTVPAPTGGVMAAGAAPTATVSGAAAAASAAFPPFMRRCRGTALLAPPPRAAEPCCCCLPLASWYQSLGGSRRMATSSPSTARFCSLRPCSTKGPGSAVRSMKDPSLLSAL